MQQHKNTEIKFLTMLHNRLGLRNIKANNKLVILPNEHFLYCTFVRLRHESETSTYFDESPFLTFCLVIII